MCDIKFWRVMALILFAGYVHAMYMEYSAACIAAHVVGGIVCAIGSDILAAIKKLSDSLGVH